jgi:hypothetical protein
MSQASSRQRGPEPGSAAPALATCPTKEKHIWRAHKGCSGSVQSYVDIPVPQAACIFEQQRV